jgi:multimeric flavodoxin WrbA
MYLAVLSGSRNRQGQTAGAAQALLEGAGEAGSQADVAFLPEMRIERCRQCDEAGWGDCRTKGRCVIDDDLPALIEKLGRADAAVFVTPVYFSDLSESLRAFLDRLRRTCTHEAGRKGIAGKPAIGVCVAGGGGGGAPACTVALEKVLSTCGFNVLDMVPARRQNLPLKREILRVIGRWLAQS